MRTGKLTADEIFKAEMAAEDRRQSRNRGYKKMHERDQAQVVLSNGVVMKWHVDRELGKHVSTFTDEDGVEHELITYPPDIPSDSFVLTVDGKDHLFNLEEFNRWLRWA